MNKLNDAIIGTFNCEFEYRCMSLLVESYFYVKLQYRIDIGCEEEYISAILFDYIDKCPQASQWNIDIVPEYRLYKNEVLKKKKSAKTAPRIDLRFCGWSYDRKLTYFIEAKNLIETNTAKNKKERKSKISAKHLHKRYIETGINNYLSGHYPSNGCLSGYILQGKTENIIDCINQHLQNCSREQEILIRQSFELPNFDSSYRSKHKNNITIKHLMFDFTVNK
jgi:hypothetical protein